MKWTGLNQLRESFLKFYENKGHLKLNSAPLIPKGDNSILLINAGMTPLKKYFQGLETPPCKRAVSCQKCIRTPDIENVGYTPRHGTYFEMLGNFSFGDYFKKEAIAWAWEFLTEKLEIPSEKLWVSIYEEDDEAGDIWHNEIGIPYEKIVKLGKKDNFWEHGSGPCGPSSEIHFDLGVEFGCGKDDCKVGCDCDRYMEIWNLVFTQFDTDGKGNYTPLSSKNIDTGMGLERLSVVMQGVQNLFEIDTIQNIIKQISLIVNRKYKDNPKDDVSIRIITDHIRSSVFMIGDGIRPSNEGRGYVLRRLIRRAARHGRLLGCEKPFLFDVADTVMEENKSVYPELNEKRDYIKKVLKTEEESFLKTVEKGLQILSELVSNLKSNVLDGKSVFKLHDTYGFPLDLTREILAEKGISIDEEEFFILMEKQRVLARSNQSFKGGWDEAAAGLISKFNTDFVGYNNLSSDTEILALIKDGQSVESVSEGDSVLVIIKATPFYAESGGQVGDVGVIINEDNIIRVTSTGKAVGGQFASGAVVESGIFFKGDKVTAKVDQPIREAVMRNHTAAHLLQAALREILGSHVHQAGSYVDSERCRFDFSHFSALTAKEIEKIESLVNQKILEDIPVFMEELPIEEANKKGAIALFGEKYGDTVRVVDIPGFSTEFCGGTHLANTSKVGLFKIISEASVAGGVRRIEAVTGFGVLESLKETQSVLNSVANILKLPNTSNLLQRTESMVHELQDLNKTIDFLRRKLISAQFEKNLIKKNNEKFTIIIGKLTDIVGDNLKKAADDINIVESNYIILLAGISEGKGNFLCKCGESAIKNGANAGKIIKEIAKVASGKGGGKPDTAMSGINDLSKIDDAIEVFEEIVNQI